jgi:hypothetical protein
MLTLPNHHVHHHHHHLILLTVLPLPSAAFLQGILPNLVKLAPAAGLSWYVFEGTKKLLGVDPRT